MLYELHVRNYAVIDNLAVEFYPGLNLLSGETGSGKSIIVDALGLALGARASPDIIRTGADRASITAIFRCGPVTDARRRSGSDGRTAPASNPSWTGWFEEYGLAGAAESEVILRREIQATGKSRLLVNDQPVTAAAVREFARRLVEVHGQNEHVALFSRDAQMDLLDQFAGVESTVEDVAVLFKRRSALEREMESIGQDEQGRLRAIDLLSFQVQEVERARLQPGEDAQVEGERRVLANLEKVRAAASSAFAQLYEDEDSVCSRLATVNRAAEELARYEAQFGPYLEPLANSRAAVEDLAFFLRDYLGRLEANPARLDELEDRLALIERLKRKYGGTIEEILEFSERSRNQLSGLLHADERRDELAAQLERASAEYRKLAEELSRKRRTAAGKFATRVREELSQLGMEKTSFEVYFADPGNGSAEAAGATSATGPQLIESARGVDQIELRMSPNPGEEPRPLERIASGGELSRLMLALKTVVGTTRAGVADKPVDGPAGTSPRLAPTFIFDEVDAGIGGRVAEQVGQRLKRLSRNSQVLCVTHLPQIACFADHHFYVEKFQRNGRTLTAVKHLENQRDRAQELARMLSGSRITDAVLKHATDMLKQAEM